MILRIFVGNVGTGAVPTIALLWPGVREHWTGVISLLSMVFSNLAVGPVDACRQAEMQFGLLGIASGRVVQLALVGFELSFDQELHALVG